MKESFILPDIGEGITECELVKWLITEGDQISEDQPIADLMTDKTIVQIPSPFNGKITKLHYEAGEIAIVNQPLFDVKIEENKTQDQDENPSEYATDEEMEANVIDVDLNKFHKNPNKKKTNLATPYARKLAKDHGVDINDIELSEDKEKITEAEIYSYIDNKSKEESVRIERLSSYRLEMARQIQETMKQIPHFTYCDKIKVNKLLDLKKFFKKEGDEVRITAIFTKALSLSLEQYPIFNSKLDMENKKIQYIKNHNIGIAIDTEHGLIVPNIKDCANKNIAEISNNLDNLINKAKNQRIKKEDINKGTITISNIGSVGGTVTTPIINKQEVIILATGKILEEITIDEKKQVQTCNLMHISWSADHRVIDGALLAKFSNYWKNLIENPENILLKLS